MFTYIFNTLAVNKQTTPTPGHVTEPVDDTRQHVHTCTCEKQMSVISMGVFPEVPIPMHYALYSQGFFSICSNLTNNYECSFQLRLHRTPVPTVSLSLFIFTFEQFSVLSMPNSDVCTRLYLQQGQRTIPSIPYQ